MAPDELTQVPPPPTAGIYLIEWFNQLSQTRQSNMSVSPISYTEIKHWSELMGITLLAWELEAIRAIDTAFIKSINDAIQREAPKP